MKSPVLFLIFRRVDTTKRVFERIREAQPPKLYIAADGPRKGRPDEEEKCAETRKVVENIDWPCEVHRLYREENLGCGKGVSSAITWFFENEEQGIIIEDDILAHIDFFLYCDEMLERYKNDERIQLISGTNYFYDGYKSDVSYYMSNYMSIWGWASWRRVWNSYNFDVNKYTKSILLDKLSNRLSKQSLRYYIKVYDLMRIHRIDTWDFQLAFNQYYYDRYSLSPYVNMVENIGMGVEGSTHTSSDNERISNHHALSGYPIVHPQKPFLDQEADTIAMINSGQYEREWYVSLLLKIIRKVKSFIHGVKLIV